MEERLQKIIAAAGFASRRKAEEIIAAGRVKVDGKTAVLGQKCDPQKCRIEIDGEILQFAENKVYYLLNKPKGYITTAKDERGRKTVLELLPQNRRIYPVGRLDRDTEGLLLLTDDGFLTAALLHPRREIEKTYQVSVTGAPTPETLKLLRNGVKLLPENCTTAPAKVKVLELGEDFSAVEITIHEGKNRQVRRMFAAAGHEVRSLKRVKFAFLTLAGVKRGEYRELTDEEVKKLYEMAGI